MRGRWGTGRAPHRVELSGLQQAAIDHVEAIARERDPQAADRIREALAAAGVEASPTALREGVRRLGRITLNFHPDRLVADGSTVAESLLEAGVYRNQFETRISNGGLTAFPGGDRDEWERRMFGEAYHTDGVQGSDRPKYGGLDLMHHPDGACPRFGSAYLRLSSEALDRATYSFGDSIHHPCDVGTIAAFSSILAAMLESGHRHGRILGRATGLADLVENLLRGPGRRSFPAADLANGCALDDYIEAQVHGPVELGRDVEALVADPSFQGSRTGENLEKAATRHGFMLDWHRGFELTPRSIPPDFRTADLPAFGDRVVEEFSTDGRLNAAVVGRAARSAITESHRWSEWGSEQDALQGIKYLWHALVRFGSL